MTVDEIYEDELAELDFEETKVSYKATMDTIAGESIYPSAESIENVQAYIANNYDECTREDAKLTHEGCELIWTEVIKQALLDLRDPDEEISQSAKKFFLTENGSLSDICYSLDLNEDFVLEQAKKLWPKDEQCRYQF